LTWTRQDSFVSQTLEVVTKKTKGAILKFLNSEENKSIESDLEVERLVTVEHQHKASKLVAQSFH
jgi:hypothetical protein